MGVPQKHLQRSPRLCPSRTRERGEHPVVIATQPSFSWPGGAEPGVITFEPLGFGITQHLPITLMECSEHTGHSSHIRSH